MAVKIWDSANECFKDTKIPAIYNKEDEFWKESIGCTYNKEGEAWEPRWEDMLFRGEEVFNNGVFNAGTPEIFMYYNKYEAGSLSFGTDYFMIADSQYINPDFSAVVFPKMIDFSKYKYIYVEGSGVSKNSSDTCLLGVVSTRVYGDLNVNFYSNSDPNNITTSITEVTQVSTTSRGYVLRGNTSGGKDYLAITGNKLIGGTGNFYVYRIWLEK